MQDLIQRKLSACRLFCKFFRWFFFAVLAFFIAIVVVVWVQWMWLRCVRTANESKSFEKQATRIATGQGKRYFYMHETCKHEHCSLDWLICWFLPPDHTKAKGCTALVFVCYSHVLSLARRRWPFANAYQVIGYFIFNRFSDRPSFFAVPFFWKQSEHFFFFWPQVKCN